MSRRHPMDDADGERLAARLLAERELDGDALLVPRAELVGMLVDAVAVGARLEFASMGAVRACRVCGCTESNACRGGCWWVGRDLCSACAPELGGGGIK